MPQCTPTPCPRLKVPLRCPFQTAKPSFLHKTGHNVPLSTDPRRFIDLPDCMLRRKQRDLSIVCLLPTKNHLTTLMVDVRRKSGTGLLYAKCPGFDSEDGISRPKISIFSDFGLERKRGMLFLVRIASCCCVDSRTDGPDGVLGRPCG